MRCLLETSSGMMLNVFIVLCILIYINTKKHLNGSYNLSLKKDPIWDTSCPLNVFSANKLYNEIKKKTETSDGKDENYKIQIEEADEAV
jgi:hypothetical protein